MGLRQDYAEFSGTPIEVVLDRVAHAREINAEDYYKHTSEEEFYSASTTYIYDLLAGGDEPEDFVRKVGKGYAGGGEGIIRGLKEYPKGENFLDFGGGTGAVCEWVARNTNFEVTYLDLPGHISDFAKWRFERYNIPVKMVYAKIDSFKLPEKYNVILSDAVWEHLDQEQQIRYARELPRYLKPGRGGLILMIDAEGTNPEMPMHYNVDISAVHSELRKQLRCFTGFGNWSSIWMKD
jgi:2-polyprenyl-3-methyl-5-hydroxy-6-metoxy-1,4-benzoquinol methylase